MKDLLFQNIPNIELWSVVLGNVHNVEFYAFFAKCLAFNICEHSVITTRPSAVPRQYVTIILFNTKRCIGEIPLVIKESWYFKEFSNKLFPLCYFFKLERLIVFELNWHLQHYTYLDFSQHFIKGTGLLK